MSTRHPPRLARALLRHLGGRFGDSLEGDLLEEFAAGRTRLWFCHQVGCALYERMCLLARQQAMTFLAATVFFLLALWAIAPASYPVMGWARAAGSLDTIVLLAWLAGVPMILGATVATAQRRRCTGAILLAAACAYLTPLTLPFTTAACDLCSRSEGSAASGTLLLLTPAGSALLAGLGAWLAGRRLVSSSGKTRHEPS
jgi:hypothetical protein